MKEDQVYIYKTTKAKYPKSPFHPDVVYPELLNLKYKVSHDEGNYIYKGVRDILKNLGLDKENYGTEEWKPFRELISPGQTAVIKPNLVFSEHLLKEAGMRSMVTHASIIRPIIDYLLISTGHNCKIIVCDVPLQSANWNKIIQSNGLASLVGFYQKKGIDIELYDLRKEISYINEHKIIYKRFVKDRDPLGYARVDLGEESALMPIIEHSKKLMITDYGKGTVSQHHDKNKNEYFIAKTILSADLFINIPKLKTHRKAGLTVACKNLIGMNGDKKWIAHHRAGSVKEGGDEFPQYNRLQWLELKIFNYLKSKPPVGVWLATSYSWLIRQASKMKARLSGVKAKRESDDVCNLREKDYQNFIKQYPFADRKIFNELYPETARFSEGSWYGNDTIWRTIADLNRIILYADKEGKIQKERQREYFCIVDAVIAGEGEGPMEQLPKKTGLIYGGFHPLAIDITAAKIMGFDYRKIPAIRELLRDENINYPGLRSKTLNIDSNVEKGKWRFKFRPTINWKGHVELRVES